jgi:signal transduction histidine kinase
MKAKGRAEGATVIPLQLREANQHLVVATVHAQMLQGQAERATAQLVNRSMLEAQLLETQKMETLGMLAAGVAHDFNNLITTIMGYTDLGRLSVAPGSDPARFFEAIDHAAMKAGELTRQLMAYSGKGKRQTVEVDLGIVVKETAQLLSVSIPGHVTLRCDLADRLPFVMGDPTQIFQIVMNLLANASEACAEGTKGRIILRTRAQLVDSAALESAGWVLPPAPGRYATLEVADTGAGMAPEVLARILEPFFTTKPTGHGLGLAAVTGILRGHGGGLRVQSVPGRGSSFTLFLPAMVEARSLPSLEVLPVWRGEGRLLIVNADPAARSVAGRLAQHLGFSVIDACDGPEAVEIFRRRHSEIALVIMALNLPRMGGEDAFRAMRAIDGQVPVVLSSGFKGPKAHAVEGLAGSLSTPFRAAEFQGLLRRALGPSANLSGPAPVPPLP